MHNITKGTLTMTITTESYVTTEIESADDDSHIKLQRVEGNGGVFIEADGWYTPDAVKVLIRELRKISGA